MLSRFNAIGIAISAYSILAFAQQGPVGTYEGKYLEPQVHDFPKTQIAILKITKAEDGKVSGNLNLAYFVCRGDFPIEGTYQDKNLNMLTGEGNLRGCGQQPLVLTIDANKLVGTY